MTSLVGLSFQDSTLECVVAAAQWWTPSIETFEHRMRQNDAGDRRVTPSNSTSVLYPTISRWG